MFVTVVFGCKMLYCICELCCFIKKKAKKKFTFCFYNLRENENEKNESSSLYSPVHFCGHCIKSFTILVAAHFVLL